MKQDVWMVIIPFLIYLCFHVVVFNCVHVHSVWSHHVLIAKAFHVQNSLSQLIKCLFNSLLFCSEQFDRKDN